MLATSGCLQHLELLATVTERNKCIRIRQDHSFWQHYQIKATQGTGKNQLQKEQTSSKAGLQRSHRCLCTTLPPHGLKQLLLSSKDFCLSTCGQAYSSRGATVTCVRGQSLTRSAALPHTQ